MPFQPITIIPGVNSQKTPLLNEAGWSESQLIRYDAATGLLEKLGGWQHINEEIFVGICRGLLGWADLLGSLYVAIGTDQRLQVMQGSSVYDITPVRDTENVATPFSTTATSTTIEVADNSHGALEGDTVIVLTTTSVGGIILQGGYTITSVIDADHYEFEAADAASSTVSMGGATPLFNTTFGSNDVEVTLADHGLIAGDVFTVYVSTSVGGFTIFGEYLVQTVIDPDTFTITLSGGASSTASGSENGGSVRLQYLLSPGLESTSPGGGYGEGGYGLGPYGEGSPTGLTIPLRQWSLEAWGQILIASPTNLAIYQWDPSGGTINNQATEITQAPSYNVGIFLAMPQRQIVAYGTEDPSTMALDPLLVRWCDVDDYEEWTASNVNQAGSYRIPRGSRIVGGMQGPQFGLLWTDLALWAMQYVQPPFIYGFTEVSAGCGLIAKRAMGILDDTVYWMSQEGFFIYDGQNITPLPCPIWDVIFRNLNSFQADKIQCGPNSAFNEIAWYYPSASGSGENDSYVKYNKVAKAWDYGSLIRTAWVDESVFGPPMGADTDGFIQQHETSADADGVAMEPSATTGWFKLDGGNEYIFIERMIPDFVFDGGATINLTVYTADYPSDAPQVYGSYAIDNSVEYVIIRSRSRLARIQISSNDLGSFWRFGQPLFNISRSGRR